MDTAMLSQLVSSGMTSASNVSAVLSQLASSKTYGMNSSVTANLAATALGLHPSPDVPLGYYPARVKNSTELTNYGVILRTDLKDRTALVKWILVNSHPKGGAKGAGECRNEIKSVCLYVCTCPQPYSL